MRLYWAERTRCAVDFGKKVKLWVSTKEYGAVNRRLNMPALVGVGYSLMPRNAPRRVCVGVRYSIASEPKKGRVVRSTSLIDARGKGTGRHSPFRSTPKYSRIEENCRLSFS